MNYTPECLFLAFGYKDVRQVPQKLKSPKFRWDAWPLIWGLSLKGVQGGYQHLEDFLLNRCSSYVWSHFLSSLMFSWAQWSGIEWVVLVILTHSITYALCCQRKHGNLEGYIRNRAHPKLEKRGNLKWKPRGKKVENKKYLKWNEGWKRQLESLINSGSKVKEKWKMKQRAELALEREREREERCWGERSSVN